MSVKTYFLLLVSHWLGAGGLEIFVPLVGNGAENGHIWKTLYTLRYEATLNINRIALLSHQFKWLYYEQIWWKEHFPSFLLDLSIISKSFIATSPLPISSRGFLTRVRTSQLLFHTWGHEKNHQSYPWWIVQLFEHSGDVVGGLSHDSDDILPWHCVQRK
jgi:hypothetical protein